MSRAKYGEPLKWLLAALLAETDECIEWPFGLDGNGYGIVRVGKKRFGAHRYLCIEAHGEPPTPQHTDAAHSCGNRKCCNKRHLRHATSLDNSRDAMIHGTTARGDGHGRSKLTQDQAREIKLSGDSGVLMARKYGISESAVSLIRSGVNWASVGV
jgi:hypothetical protein